MGKDLSSDRHAMSAPLDRVERFAKRHNIPIWQSEMALSVDNRLIRDLVRDARRGNPVTTSPSAFPVDHSRVGGPTKQDLEREAAREREARRAPGPAFPSVPGVSLIDQMYPTTAELAAARKQLAERDREALAKREAEALAKVQLIGEAVLEKAAREAEPDPSVIPDLPVAVEAKPKMAMSMVKRRKVTT